MALRGHLGWFTLPDAGIRLSQRLPATTGRGWGKSGIRNAASVNWACATILTLQVRRMAKSYLLAVVRLLSTISSTLTYTNQYASIALPTFLDKGRWITERLKG